MKASVADDVRAIEELKNSKGWAVLHRVMEGEIVQAAMAIASNPAMSLDEINFRRGSIWAAKNLLELPERLQLKLSNELAMQKADDLIPHPPK